MYVLFWALAIFIYDFVLFCFVLFCFVLFCLFCLFYFLVYIYNKYKIMFGGPGITPICLYILLTRALLRFWYILHIYYLYSI